MHPSTRRFIASVPVAASNARRWMSGGHPSLRRRLEEIVPAMQENMKELNSKHGDFVLGNVTVSKAIGGARGVPCLVWETSLLDELKGISFRGLSIPEIQKKMPTVVPGGEPTPEGMLWLLLTGEIPTKKEMESVQEELHGRSQLPSGVKRVINSLRKDMHPMTQLSIAVMAMQADSKFAKAYQHGMKKADYWKYTFEDALDLIARLPELAAIIYRRSYHDGIVPPYQPNLDFSANFAHIMGFKNQQFDELMRLYMVIHCDHEGGNVSAHTTHLVGSALSDPYLSFAAGLNGLAGPLHGLANQEVLRWVLDLQERFIREGKEVNHDTIRQFAWDTLKGGKVIPGYGHAVLRITDPRYTCQREFAQKYMPNDPLFKIVSTIYEVVPEVLKEHGKTKNPYPNVDAHSGILLTHYGLTEHNFYTVLFGVSRCIGVMSQLIVDRALGFPLERPKSLTSQLIRQLIADKKQVADE